MVTRQSTRLIKAGLLVLADGFGMMLIGVVFAVAVLVFGLKESRVLDALYFDPAAGYLSELPALLIVGSTVLGLGMIMYGLILRYVRRS